MVGVIYNKDYARFNIMMSNGKHGTIEYDNKKEIKMTKQEPVAKIVVYQVDSNAFLHGFRFYSKSGEVLLEVGVCTSPPTEFVLQEGERILGIKSRLNSPTYPYHCDLQFVIGRLET